MTGMQLLEIYTLECVNLAVDEASQPRVGLDNPTVHATARRAWLVMEPGQQLWWNNRAVEITGLILGLMETQH